MKLGGGKEWFSAAELAELALPGLPNTKRNINERAAEEGWALRTGVDRQPLARPRAARGGGLEYHVGVLPAAARSAIAKRGEATLAQIAHVSAEPETASAALWREYDAMADVAKKKAAYRLGIIQLVERHQSIGCMTETAAIAAVVGAEKAAGRTKISAASIWEWLAKIRGASPEDRLPLLAPRYAGGAKQAEVHPEVWQHYQSDFLRAEPVAYAVAYRRAVAFAKANALPLPPPARTMQRKLERETDRRLLVLRREGMDGVKKLTPSLKRLRDGMHALEAVNIDGHRWDIRCRWPDGREGRPMMVALQDVYSSKFLAWRVDEEETALGTRLVYADLLRDWGIPKIAFHDNSRAFSANLIAGGAVSRNRFRGKIRDEEMTGILLSLGVDVRFTQPYHGQAKPIERAFRDVEGSIGTLPGLAGAHTGNRPGNKPHNYGSRVIPIAEFTEWVRAGMAEHNSRSGRRGEGHSGGSFDEKFAASYAASTIRKASAEHLRLALLAAEDRLAHKDNGSVELFGNRYWCEDLIQHAGRHLTVRFDPDDLHAPAHIYDRKNRFLCTAPVFEAAGFLDQAAAQRMTKLRKAVRVKARQLEDAAQLLDAERLAALTPRADADAPRPQAGAVRPVRARGRGAAALKPASQRPLSAPQRVADPQEAKRLMAGLAKLKLVE